MSVTALQQPATAASASPKRSKTTKKCATTPPLLARAILVQATVKPRRKSRVVFDFTPDELAPYFHLPQREAAKILGVAVITIKRACKRRGIRWPYREAKLKQIQEARALGMHASHCAVRPRAAVVVSDAARAFARLPFACMEENARSIDVRL